MASEISKSMAMKELARRELARRRTAAAGEQISPEERMGAEPGGFQAPVTAGGLAKAAGTGLRAGAEAAAGAIGDIGEMGGDLSEFLAAKFGLGKSEAALVGELAKRLSLSGLMGAPRTEDIRKVTNKVVGEPRKPENVAEEFAKTIGEFAPAALTGPGGVIRKGAMAVVPAAASETAGQITREVAPELEPYARLGAAIVGGGAAAGNSFRKTVKEIAKSAPSAESVKVNTDRLYAMLRSAGIKYDANEFARMAQTATNDLLKKGFREGDAPEAFAKIRDLFKGIGNSPDFDDINALMKTTGDAARELDIAGQFSKAKAMRVVRDHLFRFEQDAPFISQAGVSREMVNQARTAARQLALKNIKQRELTGVIEDAMDYRSGFDSGLRSKLDSKLKSKYWKQLFNEAERRLLRDVAGGRRLIKSLSAFGISTIQGTGESRVIPALAATLDPMLAGATALGTGARIASIPLARRQFNTAASAIRSGQLGSSAFTRRVADQRGRTGLSIALGANTALPR